MFDYSVFLDVLANRGVAKECPACGGTELGYGDHLVGFQLVDENRNLKPQGGIAVAALACRNCGHLRLFVPAAIEGYGPSSPTDP
jgi:predicted nucleic-acid-binding Zn-ribbon protein